MTGLCFFIGVLPLVSASGAGSASRVSIGLLMIPVLYVVVERIRDKFIRKPVETGEDVQAGLGA